MPNIRNKQKGIVSPLVLFLIVAVGVVIYLVLSSTLNFQNSIFSKLFPKQSSHAAGIVDLALSPSTVSVAQNQTFLVDLGIDAKTEQPSAMQLGINYDPAMLQLQTFDRGSFFTKELVAPVISSASGTIRVTYAQDPGGYKTGSGSVSTLSFKALQPTIVASAITIDPSSTQIAAIGKTGDVTGNIGNSAVTITSTPAVVKTAEFNLSPATFSGNVGNTSGVYIRVKTPEAANLFSTTLSFDPALIQVTSIDDASVNPTYSFITQWASKTFDNTTGQIVIAGGVPNPGYQQANNSNLVHITFTYKAAGNSVINFSADSAIYRNSDNVNILQTPIVPGATLSAAPAPAVCGNGTVETGEACDTGANNGVCPKTCSSTCQVNACPTPTPTPSPVPSPSVVPSPSATPSVVPSPTPTPSPSVIPSPTPTPTPIACTISGATWTTSANPLVEKKVVSLSVTGTGDCVGQLVNFSVFEDDGLFGVDDVLRKPITPVKFGADNKAISSWLAEFQVDGFNGINNPPEYYFNAQLQGSSTTVKSTDPELQVTEAAPGTLIKGDANRDNKVDLVDMSIMLSQWNKTTDFNDEVDANDDHIINAFDFASLIQLLKLQGVLQ